jgi:undecaprenyl diphosphate synthase
MPTQPPLDPQQVLGLSRAALPRHVAIIMDGNGRWAQQRALPRIEGHRCGSEAVREIVTQCARLGLECLTLYSFSVDNWKRPPDEVEGLMALYARHLAQERRTIMDNGIRMIQLGRREGLPDEVLKELDLTVSASANNPGLTLCLALNYGARTEIVDAVRAISKRVQRGELRPDDIDAELISASLYTAGLPDPDLLIRTGGEMRVSDFLLWQISYAEIYVTPVLWPDFREEHLYDAIRTFAQRERRFGDVIPVRSSPAPSTKT